MTPEERERVRGALDEDGWYGVFRTRDGIRREPVEYLTIVAESAENGGLVTIRPTFRFNVFDVPEDIFGGVSMLGVYHETYLPEPDETA